MPVPALLIVGVVLLVVLGLFFLYASVFQPDLIAQFLVWVYFLLFLIVEGLIVYFYVWVIKWLLMLNKRFKPVLLKVINWAQEVLRNA